MADGKSIRLLRDDLVVAAAKLKSAPKLMSLPPEQRDAEMRRQKVMVARVSEITESIQTELEKA